MQGKVRRGGQAELIPRGLVGAVATADPGSEQCPVCSGQPEKVPWDLTKHPVHWQACSGCSVLEVGGRDAMGWSGTEVWKTEQRLSGSASGWERRCAGSRAGQITKTLFHVNVRYR